MSYYMKTLQEWEKQYRKVGVQVRRVKTGSEYVEVMS